MVDFHDTVEHSQSDGQREEEHALVDRAREGDEHALGELYDAYLPRIYRYCLLRVGNETDAEDIAEDIFLKVLRGIERFEWRSSNAGGHLPFAAWLFRIARNEVVSFKRREARRSTQSELTDSFRDENRGPQEITETKLTIEEVFAAAEQISDAQREVILLRFGSGLSVAETAAVLGKQQGNVKVLQHKGIKRLRELLQTEPELTQL